MPNLENNAQNDALVESSQQVDSEQARIDAIPQEYRQECYGTGDIYDRRDMIHSESNGEWYCEDYYNDNFFTCDQCGNERNNEHYYDDGVCEFCHDDGDGCEESVRTRNADLSCTEHQSDDNGKIITSQRTFGIELEVTNESTSSLVDTVDNIPVGFGAVHDGSIDGNGLEFVSPILRGKAGEKAVISLCDTLNKNDCSVNESCGYHVHLGASDFGNEVKTIERSAKQMQTHLDGGTSLVPRGVDVLERVYLAKRVRERLKEYGFSDEKINETMKEKVKRAFKSYVSWLGDNFSVENGQPLQEKVTDMFIDGSFRDHYFVLMPCIAITGDDDYSQSLRGGIVVELMTRDELDKIHDILSRHHGEYFSSLRQDVQQKISKIYNAYKVDDMESVTITYVKSSSIDKIKSLLYIYTYFTDVFFAMLPSSRHNQHFCKGLIHSFSLSDIQEVNSLDNLEQMWYKVKNKHDAYRRKSGGKYDSSRYHGVNMHGFFQNGKTIEIRYHSGTTNATKVLMWASIHQTIFDAVQNGLTMWGRVPSPLLDTNVRTFLDMFDFKPSVKKYIIDRINHFAGIKIDTKKLAKTWEWENDDE